MIPQAQSNDQLTTPVLLIIYNRPDLTYRVFSEIRKVKPSRLYVAADGPKNNENDRLNTNMCRELVKLVDWDCELKLLFRDENLGCKKAVSSAIDWFFSFEECGIILEDDCLPERSFFFYCAELLDYYKDDAEIGHIGGCNFLKGNTFNTASYYFSNYPHSWGWATWRRAWSLFDVNMHEFPEFVFSERSKQLSLPYKEKLYWFAKLSDTYLNKIDTWDYQWSFTLWLHGMKSIIPKKNLVSNIGFDERATHTKAKNTCFAEIETHNLPVIIHEQEKSVLNKADRYYFNLYVKKSSLYYMYLFCKYNVYYTLLYKLKRTLSGKKPEGAPKWSFRVF